MIHPGEPEGESERHLLLKNYLGLDQSLKVSFPFYIGHSEVKKKSMKRKPRRIFFFLGRNYNKIIIHRF